MIKLRPSQQDAYNALADARYSILNAPTGWGKSLCLSALAAKGNKVLVVVPQKAIAKGFLEAKSIKLPGGTAHWEVDLNLTGESQAKVGQLREWLTNPFGDGIAITTHHALALAWHALWPHQRKLACNGLTLIVDEAHHLQAGDEDSNRIGAAIDAMVEVDSPSSRIILATAFFFRGDGVSILKPEKLALFSRHTVPLDEYWDSLQHTESYTYDFVAFKGSFLPEFKKMVASSQEPTIVYLPREGHRLHLGKSKKETTAEVMEAIRQHYRAEPWHARTRSARVIIDLVSQEDRAEKLDFVAKHGDRVAAILSVGMFKEGADWPRASRVLDLLPSGSDQDRGQRFGRLLRDHPGKKHISYYSFLPYQAESSLEDQREQLSRIFAHFHASLVMENALSPIRLPRAKAKGKPREKVERVDYLGLLDSQVQVEVIGDCYNELIGLAAKGAFGPDDAREAIVGVLINHEVPEGSREPMARQIAALMRRRHDGGIASDDLVQAGFDKIWHEEVLQDVLVFTAGFGGPQTFQEIRAAISGAFEARWHANYKAVSARTGRPNTSDAAYWWCSYNRTLHQRGELPREKAALLEAIPWWTWAQELEDRWSTRFKEVAALAECPPSGTRMYDFVRQQRLMQAEGKLSAERVKACESIPWWTWGGWKDQWVETFESIRKLKAPPKTMKGVTVETYEWVRYQKKRRAQGKLSAERVQACESIPWWSWN